MFILQELLLVWMTHVRMHIVVKPDPDQPAVMLSGHESKHSRVWTLDVFDEDQPFGICNYKANTAMLVVTNDYGRAQVSLKG